MSRPRFSIITPCLNRARYLGAAIESLLAQAGADFEHLIIDACSTDETPALLARHPHLRVVSEPDRGLYDAINKGIALARGEFIGLLNSDDLYAPGALAAVAERFEAGVDMVTGGAEFFVDEPGGAQRVTRRIATRAEIALNARNVLNAAPVVNARFFRREFVERVGAFDLALTIAADREWLFRAVALRPAEAVMPQVVYQYREHDDSLTVHATDRNVARYREQHVAFAATHLAGSALRPDDRRALRSFHTQECAALAVLSLCRGEAGAAARWAARGWRGDALWPVTFSRCLAGRALGR